MHARSQTPLHDTRLGIGAGILAGSFWGLVFLTPILVPGFTPLQLSAGRYLAYGLVAALLVAPMWRRLLPRLGWREWRQLAWLSLCGNIVYYLFVAQAVQSGGGVMTAIVIGLLPLSVTLVGSRDHGALPLRRLAPALLLGAAGLGCIAWQSLASAQGGGAPLGLACAVGALVSWTIYAVANSRCLARLGGITAHEWSLLTGVMTGAQAVVLAVPAFMLGGDGHAGAEWLRFGGVALAVAILCSVVGNGLWNYASRSLPLALTGQLIVFETVFASLYGFMWEARWPTGLEVAALVLMVGGVVSCASAHRK
jgi:drug/metabolite transporter (DMT)-like permease